MEPKTGPPSPSLCLPTCAAASCYPHLGQPPQDHCPCFSWVFLSQPGRGTSTAPPKSASSE